MPTSKVYRCKEHLAFQYHWETEDKIVYPICTGQRKTYAKLNNNSSFLGFEAFSLNEKFVRNMDVIDLWP